MMKCRFWLYESEKKWQFMMKGVLEFQKKLRDRGGGQSRMLELIGRFHRLCKESLSQAMS